jgi:DNA-binding FadR family transcriptional regulator
MTSEGTRNGAQSQARVRVFEQVRDAVLADIRSGELCPGDKLPSERDLSQKYGVSRSAVREGLRVLEASGVLRFAKGTTGGAFVRQTSSDGIARSLRDMIALGNIPFSDVVAVRISLLQLAIDLAVTRASADDFAALDRNIDDLSATAELGDPIATIGPVMDFNRLLGKASHNPVLELVIDTVASLMEDVLERLKLPTKIDLVAPRRKIVAKLRARDAEAAKHELSRHLEQTTSYVLEHAARPQGEGDHAPD